MDGALHFLCGLVDIRMNNALSFPIESKTKNINHCDPENIEDDIYSRLCGNIIYYDVSCMYCILYLFVRINISDCLIVFTILIRL